MGIVIKQSIRNTIITFLGFGIGAINTLYMYTNFLGEDYYGLTSFLLATSNMIMPLLAFGIQNTLIKFYAEHESEDDKSRFLNLTLVLPLLVAVPVFILSYLFYDQLASLISQENPIIYTYAWMIPLIGLFMAYFEIFYAWVKVHMKSVYGNFIKEVLLRILISIFLFAVYFKWITPIEFVYCLVLIYFILMVLMAISAFKVRRPAFHLRFPEKKKDVLIYSSFIIFSAGIAVMLLEIDKFMIGQYIAIKENAYYSVAIYIALTVSVPMRAMHQIVHPITTDLMARKKHDELNKLYKKTSITLQVIGGWIMLGIFVNINELYLLLPQQYSGGITVVFIISISKFFDLMLGNNNSIIFNSKYYRTVLFLGLMLLVMVVGLNRYFIPNFGIEGAAIATLISIAFYSLSKLMFVVFKMKLFPFTKKTITSLVIISSCFLLFYFWEFPFHPVVNILLKSTLLTVLYLFLNYIFKISSDINYVLNLVMSKLRIVRL
ncbi:O-antigen/teichoic acid export membrane protein [Flavobacterium arsenatis]|uniref:O-antigen/teichoic acid export membrane protein n=1 Tax=Flavobacterium arsenatis TaxID=1484332 RepID=A0ABU1TQ16_9FLAO|nr:oligosaccharide flippase family protein [Flavobacterium arsenatis]MDR6968039.1 O-antigen/teichoic acid export membrane protein [Flavobacterium arsenatis]